MDGNGKVHLIHGFSDLFETADPPQPSGIRSESGIRKGAAILISGPPGSGKTTFALAMIRALMAEVCRPANNTSSNQGHRNEVSSRGEHDGPISGETSGNQEQKENTKKAGKVIAYYISSEVDETTLTQIYKSFGWFAPKVREPGSATDSERFQFRIDDPEPDNTNFYVITPLPEVDRPVPSPEELVNGIFNRIAHTLSPSEAPKEDARIYVIVDSVSALLKGCANAGEERRQTHEIMHRLRDRFGKDNLALTILLAEQEHRSDATDSDGTPVIAASPSIEDYLADIVFRLYTRSLPLGRRSRILDVVKSQGVNMILGEHSWQIITEDNYSRILRHEGMRRAIKLACFRAITPKAAREELEKVEIEKEAAKDKKAEELDEKKWGGIIIFPRPQLQRPPTSEPAQSTEPLPSGIEDLDHLITIRPGTTTLIAGPVGSGKTTLCKQFLRAEIEKPKPSPVLVSFDILPTGGKDNKIVILDFTQTRFDLNVLAMHIRWLLEIGNPPERIAFDGLSEWISMFDAPEAARMLEALMVTVRQSPRAPAVFMTYAMGVADDPLGPNALGMNAENILVVRQIAINDQLRRIIYVLKCESRRMEPEVPFELILQRPDPNPNGVKGDDSQPEAQSVALSKGEDPKPQDAERRVSSQATLGTAAAPKPNAVVEQPEQAPAKKTTHQLTDPNGDTDSGIRAAVAAETLDTYTGLLGRPGDLRPARVLLHLFAENESEEKFNKSLFKKLKQQHEGRLDITYSKFSRSEIGSTLDSVAKDRSPGESASVKIQSVDEWWPGTFERDKSLYDLKDVWSNFETVGWSDYWSFEVEKAKGSTEKKNAAHTGAANTGDPESPPKGSGRNGDSNADESIYAVPAYMDFGMFCVNQKLWHKCKNETDSEENLRSVWKRILSEMPRLWVRRTECQSAGHKLTWFEVNATQNEQTLLEYGLRVTGQTDTNILLRKPLFTFDMTTRETCVCAFLEFAWAFGAREGMFKLSQNQEAEVKEEKARILEALTFLQFMVIEGLMPERGDLLDKSAKTLFSRHFYSTLIKHYEKNPKEPHEKIVKGAYELMALPFMPTGLDRDLAMSNAIADIKTRLGYWKKRVMACLDWDNPKHLQSGPHITTISHWLDSEDETLAGAIKCYSACRELILLCAREGDHRESRSEHEKDNHDEDNRKLIVDLDDLIELTTWAAFRLQLLAGAREGRFPANGDAPVASAMESMRTLHQNLPDLSGLKAADGTQPVFTGYSCTGSWMYGVSKRSRAPSLQAQLLRELSSLDSVEVRAKTGAGMPARKDFFHLHGADPVPGLPYLNWREFLRYNGSRARRRDRVLENRERIHSIYTVIQQEMLACLRVAALHKAAYAAAAAAKNDTAKATIVEAVTQRAKAAVEQIFEAAGYGRTNH